MKQYYMVIDVSLCHDCNNCFLACKDEHVGNQWLPYTEDQPRHGHKWIDILSTERGLFPFDRRQLFANALPALRRCTLHEGLSRLRISPGGWHRADRRQQGKRSQGTGG